MISFHSIAQSPRKFIATSDHAPRERIRSRQGSVTEVLPWTWPTSAFSACRRAASSSFGDTNSRRVTAMSTISTTPPTYSASVNCQPISTHSTRPSSQTRLVEANWNASMTAADAPLAKSERPIAMAA